MLFRPKMLISASAVALLATTGAAVAADEQVLETVVVTGLRSTLTTAANIKKASAQVQDSIVAEDIGKLPDTNIAETLQRIPGVQIARNTRGEGNTYVIHGLKQVMTTMNGRELFNTTNRTAPLLDFSSDILSGLDVYKTATADQIEGGLGGLINIRTARPFDSEGARMAATAGMAYSEFSDRAGPRGSGIVSDRWEAAGLGEVGLLAGVQYEKFYSGGYQVMGNTYADSKALFDVNGNGVKNETADTVTLPSSIRPRYETGDRTRWAYYGSAQWKPTSELEFHLDGLYQYSSGQTFTQQLVVSTSGATGVGVPTFKSGTTVPSSYTLSNPQIQSNTGAAVTPYYTWNIAFGADYHSGPLSVSAEGSYVNSHGAFYSRTAQLSGRATGARVSLAGDTPDVAVTGVDPTSLSAWPTASYSEYSTFNIGHEPSFRIDASYDLNLGPITTLMAGTRWSQHRSVYDYYGISGGALNQTIASVTELTPNDLFTDQNPSVNQWLAFKDGIVKTPAFVRSLFGVPGYNQTFASPVGQIVGDPGSHYDYMETIWAGYGEAKFAFEAGLPIDGNIGLRYVRTSGQQLVFVKDTSGNYQSLKGGAPYENWLPSANLRVSFSDDLFLRLAYSKGITRPDYGNLSPAVVLNTTALTASAGNPDLKPTKADMYDVSLEYYFSKSNYAVFALFMKDASGFIQKFYAAETINGVEYQVSRPRNSGGGKIKGFELTYQQFFDFLPGLWRGLGMQATYTFVDSGLKQYGISYLTPADLLSKHSYNITGIYEEGPVSLHVSYNWRSKNIQSNNADRIQSLWNAPIESLDVSGTYMFDDHWSIKADAVNITGAYGNQFYGTTVRSYLANQNDRTYQVALHVSY